MTLYSFRPLAGAALALGLILPLAGESRADPWVILTGWFAAENNTAGSPFTAADPVADSWVCHEDVHLEEAGGHPDFHIEITGDCAFVPRNYNPASGSFSPAWVDVVWKGTYHYETGIGSERLKRADGGRLYDVNLQCQPDKNPFIHTGSCSQINALNSAGDMHGSPPLSGGRLDGYTRQNLIAWEQQQTTPQEGEGMDLAPNADAPRIVSPTPGGAFPNWLRVELKPATRGVPMSNVYQLEFYFTKRYESASSGKKFMAQVAPSTQILSERQPNLTLSLDWSTHPDGLNVPLSQLGRSGHWTVRARMDIPTGEWTGYVPFTAGIESKVAMPVGSSGIGKIGEKKLDTMKRAGERTLQRTNGGATAGAAEAESAPKAGRRIMRSIGAQPQ